MTAALTAVLPATDSITLPVVLTVAIATVAVATVALVAIAVFVRRSRQSGKLSGVDAVASGVSAVGVLVSAFIISVALGGTVIASAHIAPTGSPAMSPAGQVIPAPSVVSGDLDGFQLPTE